jgi:uncharacterized protein YqgC (DUF456 family)
MELVLWLLAVVLVLIGLVGTVLPALPGAPLVWLGLLVAAWAEGFTRVSGWTLALLAALAALTLVADYAAAALGAQRVGASRWAIVGAFAGSLIGLVAGLPGLILGAFAGAAAGEFAVRRSWPAAGKVGLGTTLGLIIGIAGKLAVVTAMLGTFALAYAL